MAADVNNPDSGSGAVLLCIYPLGERRKLMYQIGTGEASLALLAAEKVANDVDGIDINMGCSKKFSVSGGMGSALLSDAKRACDILSTLRRNLGNKPVLAKVQLLHPTDPRPTLDFVRLLIKAGANAVAIHGRIVSNEAHKMARWEMLVKVIRQLKGTECVSIIANGDLYMRADIREMKRRSSCDGVMLARPALYNVSIFRRGEEGDETTTAAAAEGADDDGDVSPTAVPLPRFQTMEHLGYYGYRYPLLRSCTFFVREYIALCVRYKNHSKNSKYVVLEMMNARQAPSNCIPFLEMMYKGGQTIANICKCCNSTISSGFGM
jgi:tRNA-dihydrouridine synthase 2